MAICPITNNRRFFTNRMSDSPEAAEKVRKFYCHIHFQRCARHVYAKISETPAPDSLLPNAKEEVSDTFGCGLVQR